MEVAFGKKAESTALHCPRCLAVDVNGSWRCSGKDAAGKTREGRYLCRMHRLGPPVKSAGSCAPAFLGANPGDTNPGDRF